MLTIFSTRPLLVKVRRILGWTGGGVHKRIDENRELLELLCAEAPELVIQHPYLVNWLHSQDEFLSELASTVPIREGRFLSQTTDPRRAFPRPWPSETVEFVQRRIAASSTHR
jgi:hypothetical protein